MSQPYHCRRKKVVVVCTGLCELGQRRFVVSVDPFPDGPQLRPLMWDFFGRINVGVRRHYFVVKELQVPESWIVANEGGSGTFPKMLLIAGLSGVQKLSSSNISKICKIRCKFVQK